MIRFVRLALGLMVLGATACGSNASGTEDPFASGDTGGSATGAGGANTGGGLGYGTGGKTGGGGAAGGGTAGGGAGGTSTGAGGTLNDAGSANAKKSPGCGKTPPQTGYVAVNSIQAEGTDRAYALAVSAAYNSNTPVALVFSWHGSGGNGVGDREGYAWNLEKKMVALFVYPTALDGGNWDLRGTKDYTLYETLYTYLTDNYCIDENRVFSLGFSMGAIFTNSLGCKYGSGPFQLRGLAPQAGSGPSGTCTGKIAWFGTHGVTDGSVSFASGQASRDYWAKTNGCATTTTPYNPQPTPGPYAQDKQPTCVMYDGCDAGFPVHWCTFDGGHDWQEWPHFTMATFFNALK